MLAGAFLAARLQASRFLISCFRLACCFFVNALRFFADLTRLKYARFFFAIDLRNVVTRLVSTAHGAACAFAGRLQRRGGGDLRRQDKGCDGRDPRRDDDSEATKAHTPVDADDRSDVPSPLHLHRPTPCAHPASRPRCEASSPGCTRRLSHGSPVQARRPRPMDLAGQLSNQEIQAAWEDLAAVLDRVRASEPAERPRPRPRQVRRHGEVRDVITQLLAGAESPLRAREIHRAVERELGEDVPWSSISNCLRRNSATPAARFRKVGHGLYELAG